MASFVKILEFDDWDTFVGRSDGEVIINQCVYRNDTLLVAYDFDADGDEINKIISNYEIDSITPLINPNDGRICVILKGTSYD